MNILSRIAFLLTIAVSLGACGTWYHSSKNAYQFATDKAQCQAIANGAAPMTATTQQTSTTTYHSGTVTGSDGTYSNYSGTSTTNTNPYTSMGNSLTNLGATLQRRTIVENCLMSKGYWKE